MSACGSSAFSLRLNQVTLPAVSVDDSIKFYSGMGFLLIVHDPKSQYARFEDATGATTFSLHGRDMQSASAESDKANSAIHSAGGTVGGQHSAVVIYFESESAASLDAYVKHLKQNGYKFLHEPRDESWGWRESRLKDPSGNEICLYHAGEKRRFPPWRLETAGGPGSGSSSNSK